MKKYKDSVAKWTTMLHLMEKSDRKAQDRLAAVGFMLYLAHDDEAMESMNQTDTEGTLSLERADRYEERGELLHAVMYILATESPTEKIRREIEMSSDIHT